MKRLPNKGDRRRLGIERTHHPAGRKALIVAGAIESFDQYFETASDKDPIVRFVGLQEGGESPKARKLAKEFLKKWGKLP